MKHNFFVAFWTYVLLLQARIGYSTKLKITVNEDKPSSNINLAKEALDKIQSGGKNGEDLWNNKIELRANSTKLWVNSDLKLFTEEDPVNSVVELKLKRELNDKGWNRLTVDIPQSSNNSGESFKITNNPYFKMYLAGYLEGRITCNDINLFFGNMKSNYKTSNSWNDLETFFKKVSDNLIDNIKNKKTVVSSIDENYSAHITLSIMQLIGLTHGYNFEAKQSNAKEITVEQFLIIQADGELSELLRMVSYKKTPKNFRVSNKDYLSKAFGIPDKESDSKLYKKYFHARLNMKLDRCSALVKVLNDENGQLTDLMVGHVTWSDYSEGIKYIKNYNFGGVKLQKESNNTSSLYSDIPNNIIFSAYAGTVSSTDDYYITSSSLVVTETTLSVYDVNLYKYAKSEDEYIPNFARVNSAVLYSKSGEDWIKQFSINNSGTYSSQWIIVDYNKIQGKSNILNVLEQTPKSMITYDMTSQLLNQAYFPSYNEAFFSQTQSNLAADLNEIYTSLLTGSERGIIFKNLHSKVKDSKTFKDLLMYNGYMNNNPDFDDPSNKNAAYGLSSRYDLTELATPFGGTDFKMTNLKMIKEFQLVAHNGPTIENNNNLTVFSWDEFDKSSKDSTSHLGVPSKFAFKFYVEGAQNYSTEWN